MQQYMENISQQLYACCVNVQNVNTLSLSPWSVVQWISAVFLHMYKTTQQPALRLVKLSSPALFPSLKATKIASNSCEPFSS